MYLPGLNFLGFFGYRSSLTPTIEIQSFRAAFKEFAHSALAIRRNSLQKFKGVISVSVDDVNPNVWVDVMGKAVFAHLTGWKREINKWFHSVDLLLLLNLYDSTLFLVASATLYIYKVCPSVRPSRVFSD